MSEKLEQENLRMRAAAFALLEDRRARFGLKPGDPLPCQFMNKLAESIRQN